MKKRRGRQGRCRTLVRVLKVFVALARTRFGVTFQELLEEAECSRRTLYRDLSALDEAGVRISVIERMTGERARRAEAVDGLPLRGVA